MLIFAVRTQNGNIMGENEMQFPSEKLKEGMGLDEMNYPLDGRLLTKNGMTISTTEHNVTKCEAC